MVGHHVACEQLLDAVDPRPLVVGQHADRHPQPRHRFLADTRLDVDLSGDRLVELDEDAGVELQLRNAQRERLATRDLGQLQILRRKILRTRATVHLHAEDTFAQRLRSAILDLDGLDQRDAGAMHGVVEPRPSLHMQTNRPGIGRSRDERSVLVGFAVLRVWLLRLLG